MLVAATEIAGEPEKAGGAANGRLTERDRQLIGALAEARYLSTGQLRRLFFPGRAEQVSRRRLPSLAGEGVCAFPQPSLRRLFYRTYEGARVSVWGLTQIGYLIAESVLGRPLKAPKADVGAEFLEHAITLNELYVGLLAAPLEVRAARSISGRVSRPQFARMQHDGFRWSPTESVRLPWTEYDTAAGKKRDRLIQPDAVLELVVARRRLFLECEMGTHSIVATSDEKQGATLAKVERYDEFLAGFADAHARQTFYQRSYPDGLAPEVWFLVHSDARQRSVTQAIADWRRGRAGVAVRARALTFAQARDEFLPLLGVQTPAAPRTADGAVTPEELTAIHAFYRSVYQHYKTARDRARGNKEPVPDYPEAITEVHRFLANRGVEKAS